MAPALSPELEELAAFFQRCGLTEQRATETARSKGAPAARDLFSAANLDQQPLDDKQGALVLQLSKDGAKLSDEARLYVVQAIRDGRLLKSDQVTGKSTLSLNKSLMCPSLTRHTFYSRRQVPRRNCPARKRCRV